MANEATISLCMIVKDESEWIGKCLAAAKGLVGQMVVVDTGSSDNTVEIAKGLGAEVYHFEWNDDTSAARNEGLKHATGDWILVLDADETIAASDFDRIKQLLAGSEYDGYALVQRNYANDTYREDFIWAVNDPYGESKGFTGWVPRLIVRLFRNKPEIRFEGIAHELVEGSIKKSGGKFCAIDIPIHHFKELKSQDYLKAKPGHYRRIGEKKLADEPNNARAWQEMGTVEREAGNFAKAKGYFQKAVELDGSMVEAWQGLGMCCSSLGDVDSAIAAFRKAIELNPEYPTAYFSLGVAYSRLGRLNDARDAIEEGLKRNPNDFNALTNLGAIYEQGGHPEIGAEILQQVVSIDKNNSRAFYNLGVALEKLGRNEEAANAYEKAAGLNYSNKGEALKRAATLRQYSGLGCAGGANA
ncbi:tetratricopeptide repeat protein [Candidatus Woesearchaeota archaeon]|nr:tetratricopeptide repeat protein [Candidatus Woesearchaeota archaeon]